MEVLNQLSFMFSKELRCGSYFELKTIIKSNQDLLMQLQNQGESGEN